MRFGTILEKQNGTIRSVGQPVPEAVLTAFVQRGKQLGRTIGFPTANLDPGSADLRLDRGVYAAHATLDDGRRFAAAVNVGVRPTVDDSNELIVEAHLLDFDEDIYDRGLTISFLVRLRSEREFQGLQALRAQLYADVAEVRRLLTQ